MFGKALNCFYQIRNKIGAALIIGLDLRPCRHNILFFGYQTVIEKHKDKQNRRNNGKKTNNRNNILIHDSNSFYLI